MSYVQYSAFLITTAGKSLPESKSGSSAPQSLKEQVDAEKRGISSDSSGKIRERYKKK